MTTSISLRSRISTRMMLHSALQASPCAIRPTVVVVDTTPYSSLDNSCVFHNAGCVARVTADYQRFITKVDRLVVTYTNALANPDEYTKTGWQIHIKWTILKMECTTALMGPDNCDGALTRHGACRASTRYWRDLLDLYSTQQSQAAAWWLEWNNDATFQDEECSSGTTSWKSIARKLGFITSTHLNEALDKMPSTKCPGGATESTVSIRNLSKVVGGDYDGQYKAPPLCCNGGPSKEQRHNEITCTFDVFGKLKFYCTFLHYPRLAIAS